MNIAKPKEKCTKLSMSVSTYQLVKAAKTNNPIKQHIFIFIILEAGQSNINVLADLISDESCLPFFTWQSREIIFLMSFLMKAILSFMRAPSS